MRNFKKRAAISAAVCAFALASLSGCGALDDSASAVTVGEEAITAGVLNFYARFQQGQYETYYAPMIGVEGEKMWDQPVDEKSTYEDLVREQILKSMEDMYVIRQHAKDCGVDITDEEKKAIDKVAADFMKANEKDEAEAVSGSEENIQEVLALLTIQYKMHEQMTAGADTVVSDEEAAQKAMQYVSLSFTKTEEDGTQNKVTDEEKAAMRDAVQDMIDLIKTGEAEDLTKAAEQLKEEKDLAFQIDVRTASFDASSTYPAEDIVKAADALKEEGDVTDLIEDETKAAAAYLTSLLDRKATDERKENIISERKNKAYTELLDKWREETKIEVNEKVWKKIDFKKQGVKIKQKPAE